MDDAIDGTAEAPASASAVGSPTAPVGSSSAESDTGGVEVATGPGGITKLPETGGASLTALVSGVVLAALGLMPRKVLGR